ncbi:GNAT family N-acetyltransferase [Sphingomonas sp. NFR15]|uniref:GNAT family N-acetyltransferase n=1 Tax=Sphingomonas sp. NFR15 TaxID=1566282 RepID=UPI000885EC84|nr:GNAT family N-acetyltransferase [Sphingomonas sp. NFR15]SDA29412.1 Protein N-acetyltransferase, RimJ/RimL family [Sphingomonas sp. NFR15]
MSDVFTSARLVMRPQRVDDAEALHLAYRDVELMRFWSSGPHASVAETRAYLAARGGPSPWRGWVMTLAGDDTAIGTLAAGEKRPGVVEIGYLLARAHWGQGYAREGVSRLLDLLFREEGARRVFADTDPENDASNRLLRSLGFTLEGVLRGEWETHIGVRDTNLWGLLLPEWLDR